jgi:hypothetical protein
MLHRVLCVLLLCLLVTTGYPQAKSLTAVKTTGIPKIDGSLTDAAWNTAPLVTDFIQNYPAYGQPATNRSVVKILYDNEAIYIGAYLYDDPQLIRSQLTSRDGEQRQDVDFFSVFFDTYNDQQNGFQFLVTSANVQSDARLGANIETDFGEYGDKTWDAVWQSKTSIQADGWVAEIRIPYISLRFAKRDVQTWGLQFLRFTRRNNESDFWNPVDPNVAGFVNQFGLYGDLINIKPPLRLSLSPYLSGGVRRTPVPAALGSASPNGGKTTYNTEWLRNGGMDVKYGINESFTLDATLIPDFGQVISDNLVNNLTPYEIQFNENRPFFTEGTELFNKAGLFYSRRIGDVPNDYFRVAALANDAVNIRKNPGITQLYNAVKFSGRTKKKLGIGIFNAVTAPAKAVINSNITGRDSSILTEPLTNYNILVLDQAFKGRSYLTFTNTNVMRNGAARDANVAALNFAAYDKTNTYSVSGAMNYSQIFGLTPYNYLASPYKYISDVETDTVAGRQYIKPYDGFRTTLNLGKVSGKIQYGAGVNVESDAYDPNDLGFIEASNEVTYTGGFSYNQFTPTKTFVSYNYNLNLTHTGMYKPHAPVSTLLEGNATWVFKNFWDVSLNMGTQPFWQADYFELQTRGRFVKKQPFLYAFLYGSTDSRKRLYANYHIGLADGGVFEDNTYLRTNGGVRYRFSNKFTLDLQLRRQHDNLQIGYAYYNDPDTREPVLGFRDYKDVTMILSGNYNFTSRMNITLRARHYWNSVHYRSFYNVKQDGFYTPHEFIPGLDQNVNIFNVDAFFTWDFRPGSRVIAGYKNSLGSDYWYDLEGKPYERYGRNLRHTFQLPHGNELTLRVIYFLDYNQFRRRG